MTASILTQSKIKELLDYNQETGIFTRAKRTTNSINIGDIAGTKTKKGYIRIRVADGLYMAHRLAWLYVIGVWPKYQVDHENHIRDDNRWVNLSAATNQENSKNMSLSKRSTSGVCGVVWHKNHRKWQTYIAYNDKKIHLGYFGDFFEACCSRFSANNKYGYHRNHGQ